MTLTRLSPSVCNCGPDLPGGISGLGIDLGVEPRVVVGVAEHDGLLRLGHVAADPHAEGNNHVFRVGATQSCLETLKRERKKEMVVHKRAYRIILTLLYNDAT